MSAHLSAARSKSSTASTEVWSRMTEAPRQAEKTSGNITKAEACRAQHFHVKTFVTEETWSLRQLVGLDPCPTSLRECHHPRLYAAGHGPTQRCRQ